MSERPVPPARRIPSEDGARLAVVLRKTQWLLDDVAHDLPAGRCTPEQLHRLATLVRKLGDHLDAAAGIVPGETSNEGGDL